MSATTSIEWTDRTWNPVTGCRKVSPGCKHCYAEGVAKRFWHHQYVHTTERGFIPVKAYAADALTGKLRQFTDVMTHAERLLEPLSWRKPARVFVNSMSDLFHEDVPDAFIDQVFHVMQQAERHTFQVLTKRADRMRAYAQGMALLSGQERGARVLTSAGWSTRASEVGGDDFPWPLQNVWLGVSVEDQERANERIPLLLQTPSAVRFISAEPLLGPVDLERVTYHAGHEVNAFTGGATASDDRVFLGHPFGPANVDSGLTWVIVGGESGPGARPVSVRWIRSLVAQCQEASVPVFVKQLGAQWFDPDRLRGVRGSVIVPVDSPWSWVTPIDRKGGDPVEWPEDLRIREFPR